MWQKVSGKNQIINEIVVDPFMEIDHLNIIYNKHFPKTVDFYISDVSYNWYHFFWKQFFQYKLAILNSLLKDFESQSEKVVGAMETLSEKITLKIKSKQ